MKLFVGAVLVVIAVGFSVTLYAIAKVAGNEDLWIEQHDLLGNRNEETEEGQDGTENI
jgi:hypothetical protein